MKIEKFEDIIAWQKAKYLTLAIYQDFKNCNDFNFRGQIQRVAVSVMNNIAEGFERHETKGFKHFLFIAKGSCAEVRSMLYLAVEMKLINKSKYAVLNNTSIEI